MIIKGCCQFVSRIVGTDRELFMTALDKYHCFDLFDINVEKWLPAVDKGLAGMVGLFGNLNIGISNLFVNWCLIFVVSI